MLYYLGIPVEPVMPLDGRRCPEGWVWARWPDGREFLHWAEQLRPEPKPKKGKSRRVGMMLYRRER